MLFWYEVRNVLLQAERKNRISQASVDTFLADFNRLAVGLDTMPDEASVMVLARRYALSSYDAAYLELAKRADATIATLDMRLRAAAASESVPILPDP